MLPLLFVADVAVAVAVVVFVAVVLMVMFLFIVFDVRGFLVVVNVLVAVVVCC